MRFINGSDYGRPYRNRREADQTIDQMLRQYGIAYVCEHPEILFKNSRDPVARFIEAYRILNAIYAPTQPRQPMPDPMSVVREGAKNSYGHFLDYHG
jgi:hypothetical protein